MASEADLARRILLRLAVLQAGEQPSHDESQDVIATMRSVHAAMLDKGMIDWPLDEIPVRCEDAWINYMAWKVSADFGLTTQEVAARGDEGFNDLIALSAQPIDSRDIPVTNY